MLTKKILVIYPQVRDTKIAVFHHNSWVFFKTIKNDKNFTPDTEVLEQEVPRTEQILNELKDNDIDLNDIGIVIGRGGLIKPIKSGIYEIS